MSYQDIANMIESIGLPFAYRYFPIGDVPDLPYIVFYYPSRENFGADNIAYVPFENVNIELYTENKDFSTEESVEAVLTQNGFFYEKSETYLSTEQMYEVLYEIQFIKE